MQDQGLSPLPVACVQNPRLRETLKVQDQEGPVHVTPTTKNNKIVPLGNSRMKAFCTYPMPYLSDMRRTTNIPQYEKTPLGAQKNRVNGEKTDSNCEETHDHTSFRTDNHHFVNVWLSSLRGHFINATKQSRRMRFLGPSKKGRRLPGTKQFAQTSLGVGHKVQSSTTRHTQRTPQGRWP